MYIQGGELPARDLHVLVNAYRALPADAGAGGAGKFLNALIIGLAPRVQLRVLVSAANRDSFPQVPGAELVIVPGESELAYRTHFDWCSIYYDPLNGLRPLELPPAMAIAAAIMDLQHNLYPRNFPGGMYEARNRDYGFAIRRATGVITISQFERQNILRVYGAEIRVHVTHLTGFIADHPLETRAWERADLTSRIPAAAAEQYLIFPAVPWRHKNHYRTLEAIGLLRSLPSLRIPDLRVICTGIEKHGSSSNIHLWKHAAEGLDDVVEFLGHLAEAEFATLMRHARGLLFPSLYEGFGIPIVEAMQLGVPVLTVRETAVPEIAGDAVQYFHNPRDPFRMAQDIHEFWTTDDLREQLARRGRIQGQQFSTQRFAEDTLAALTSILDHHLSRPMPEVGHRPPLYRELEQTPPLTILCVVERLPTDDIAAAIRELRPRLRLLAWSDTPILWIIDRGIVSEDLGALVSELGPGEGYTLAAIADRDEVTLALRFGCESFTVSEYVIYIRSGLPPAASHASLVTALTMLDRDPEIGGALLHPGNTTWSVVSPVTDETRASEIVLGLRDRPLQFFENVVLRSGITQAVGHIGTVRLVSHFVRKAAYLTGPAF